MPQLREFDGVQLILTNSADVPTSMTDEVEAA
jgi:hypothetical protein